MQIAKYEKKYSFIQIIGEQELRRIYEILLEHLRKVGESNPEITFNLKFSDNSSYKTENLEEVLKEENTANRSIERLEIHAVNNEYLIKIIFDVKSQKTAQVKVEGPSRQWTYVTMSIIEDRLNTFKEDYPTSNKRTLYLFLFLLIVFSLLFFFNPQWRFINKEGQDSTAFFILILPVVLMPLLNKPIDYIFPDLVFKLGKGIIRYNRIATLRSNLFWVVLIGLLVGLFGSLILQMIK